MAYTGSAFGKTASILSLAIKTGVYLGLGWYLSRTDYTFLMYAAWVWGGSYVFLLLFGETVRSDPKGSLGLLHILFFARLAAAFLIVFSGYIYKMPSLYALGVVAVIVAAFTCYYSIWSSGQKF